MKLQSGWEEAHSVCPMLDRRNWNWLHLDPRLLLQPNLQLRFHVRAVIATVPLVHLRQSCAAAAKSLFFIIWLKTGVISAF